MTGAGCRRRCPSVGTGITRGNLSRNSRLSRCSILGGATRGGVCLTNGMRVSRIGLMRGLPTETDNETDVFLDGC